MPSEEPQQDQGAVEVGGIMVNEAMLRVAIPAYMEKHKDAIDGLVTLLNKAQRLTSLSYEACTGTEYPVRDIKTDLLIKVVARNGIAVFDQVLTVIDSQLNDGIAALEAAFQAADEVEVEVVEDAPAPAEESALVEGATVTAEGDEDDMDEPLLDGGGH